eukprot:5251346-Amphidinium_carterae.1
MDAPHIVSLSNTANKKPLEAWVKGVDAAIVVVSLIYWRDEKEEMGRFLEQFAQFSREDAVKLRYVVVATHRDEFLRGSCGGDGFDALEKAIAEIRSKANTNH